jgi:hypothetical protein
VSHAPERTEKNCLNCGATVIGRFCHICGQENIEPKESFGKLVLHFFYDITHFDGKFFESVKDLMFRPGFLSKEYFKGRRASYLNPVRMYVFTSAIFFLIFFMATKPENFFHPTVAKPLTEKQRAAALDDLENEYKKSQSDTVVLLRKIELLKNKNRIVTNEALDSLDIHYKSFEEYDSIQKTKPPSERNGWLNRLAVKKFKIYGSTQKNQMELGLKLTDIFLHKLPYLLFVSLPLFALILRLLYVRRRKEFYYADHAIFSIHHYILSFILLLFCFLLDTIYDLTGFGIFRIILLIFLFGIWPIHLYIAMLNFYKQKWFKTFIKFLFLNLLGFLTVLILFVIFLLISLIQL